MKSDIAPSIHLSDEAIRRLVLLRSGTATEIDHAELSTWRAAMPEHERAYREAEHLWNTASKLAEDPATGLVHPVAHPQRRRTRRYRSRILRVLTAAAGIVIALGAGFQLVVHRDRLLADYATDVAQVRSVTLEDGSIVSLNAGSAIDVHFDDGLRRIVLRNGDALFRVQHDAYGRAFQVEAVGVTVTALGTEFEVDRLGDGGVHVAVSEHAVAIATRGDTAPLILPEGQQLSIDASGRAALPDVYVGHVATWRQNRLIAEGQPLAQVIDSLSRYHHGWIVVEDAVANLSVSAVLDLSDPLGSLQTLSAAVPIKVRTITPYLIIVSHA